MGRNDFLAEVLFQGCMEEVFVFGENGQILDANPIARKETGYFDELLACNITDIFPQIFDRTKNKVSLKEEYPTEKAFTSVAYCKNRVCFPVRIKVWWQTEGAFEVFGRYSFGMCVAGDISYQAEAKKRVDEADELLARTNQVRNEFVANMTHELRTPVNGISGLANDLKKSELSREQREDVDIILHCCNNMSLLINKLLDFSKLEAGKLDLEERRFSLKEMFDKLLAVYRPIARQKRLKQIINISSELPEIVIGDCLRLEQIFHNLMSNAIKFTSEGYVALEVLVTTRTENTIEMFSRVIDTGIGIPEDKQDQLFLSFSQLDGSITRKHGGTGLGLSICKQLITMMGGSIRVDSEPGKGSIFSFTVRLRTEETQIESAKLPEVQRLVDQNEAIRKWLEPEELAPEDRKKRFEEIFERFVISIEMENKERAEEFAEQLKAMLPESEKELWRAVLRVQMDVRKADYERAAADMEILQGILGNE